MHQLRIYIIGYKNLNIISNQNLEIILTMKEIYPIIYDSYCMVHLSKNLMCDVRDREDIMMFWVTRSPNLYKFNKYMQKWEEKKHR